MSFNRWFEIVSGKEVMLKVQPRGRKTIYQITTEHHVLTKLKQLNNPKLLMQEVLAYGCHNSESYVLVTGLAFVPLLLCMPCWLLKQTAACLDPETVPPDKRGNGRTSGARSTQGGR